MQCRDINNEASSAMDGRGMVQGRTVEPSVNIAAPHVCNTQIYITGQIQGVGFRPFVYRLATQLNLSGWVQNTAEGVTIEIQGEQIETFIEKLQTDLPPLAKIVTLEINHENINNTGEASLAPTIFTIKPSENKKGQTQIPPDIGICKNCLAELFDPSSRYYLYPFISCTDCGPRYSLITQMPYDRHNTSMDKFILCECCDNEYNDINNRRFHAETMACGECGPQLSHSFQQMADGIRSGKIIAMKSLGGYQLICDANNPEAIQKLRQFKLRKSKPFALMLSNIASIEKIAELNDLQKQILESQEKPIVLLTMKDNKFADYVAPGLHQIGVMLPYTGSHHLLFHYLLKQKDDIQLIVTSANKGDEPLIIDDSIAKNTLSQVADLIVSYDRDIIHRVDDSLVKLINDTPFYIRRARAYAPQPIILPMAIPSTLALGGYLKNTICVTKDNQAYLSSHIGDLNSPATLRAYKQTIENMLELLDIQPERIAMDLDPNYYANQITTQYDLPIKKIQHHHAHLAACAIDNLFAGEALGLALDGFGLGDNHQSWGGELFSYTPTQIKRIGHLKPIMQPGGDIAAREPWRMAQSILFALGKDNALKPEINEILSKQINSPYTSSCGRLFDAASALLGICQVNEYEGQAAMMLEHHSQQIHATEQMWKINDQELNLLPLFEQLSQCDKISGASLFHSGLVNALTDWIVQIASKFELKTILLSGGCFQNKILSEGLVQGLQAAGLMPLMHKISPANDAGIALGQAWLAGRLED